ncbi:MAG: hypothetical protein KAJ34_04720, partial [Thermodesulfovibrionia bacterium]|nr:hypothetical protein [Thermodesulfovibrionia bacterium]
MTTLSNSIGEPGIKEKHQTFLSIGLFILRLAVGSMMLVSHGWGKLIHFGEKAAVFPDPFGLGSPISLSFAIFA